MFLAVATVLTVYGIETVSNCCNAPRSSIVATVLTVYGIETEYLFPEPRAFAVATVLTVYGIETFLAVLPSRPFLLVATVLTVYGIETLTGIVLICSSMNMLQQYLPFTVLKLHHSTTLGPILIQLQQYLPFTVLKLCQYLLVVQRPQRCNSTYRLRY